MKTDLQHKLSQALLRGNPVSSPLSDNAHVNPVSEMPMILTLEQLQPNPDNPRQGRNPRYEEIKSSIRARGLDSVPKVTKVPGSEFYIFSDGGNTRYQILSELWQETQDERFFRLHVLFKPWPGRLQCLIGHLAENEVRGELTFLEKAQGICVARSLYEETLGKKLSLRAFAQRMTADGLPVSISHISKMEDTVSVLLPYMPRLLENGLGRPQIEQLLSVRSTLKRVADSFLFQYDGPDPACDFLGCFERTCTEIDNHDVFDYDVFLDELIGRLLRECSVAGVDYERWVFELKVNKGRRSTKPELPAPVESEGDTTTAHSETVPTGMTSGFSAEDLLTEPLSSGSGQEASVSPVVEKKKSRPVVEIQTDLYGGAPVLSGDTDEADIEPVDGGSLFVTNNPEHVTPVEAPVSGHAVTALTCQDLWPVASHLDDIEHLQTQIYRTLFELGNELDLSSAFMAASGVHSPGFITLSAHSVLGRVMTVFSEPDESHDDIPDALRALLTGGYQPGMSPVLNDTQFMTWMKLMYLLRCLYAKQRDVDPDVNDEEEWE
ncbi:TPA: chromosome partitioning protein ParB [Proteus mirabilis]|nr:MULTISPECIES: ParB family protein [Enterobacterales]MBA7797073.1 chromosome partitioning protein ParB [Citrobacter sp. RHBSTW-01065]HCF8064233.1 chromosome partitioning protein ParB [Klebsiella michiganensis]HDS6292672.1 chromosome partitioning protein ParB [Klebsiella pneumoniae subsp. pneumoniae]HDU8569002.1 chromosome partitioning protein ParB [Morganella morganii]HEM6894993.1 chromosome partitioning protein ParB [Providencia stuartii]